MRGPFSLVAATLVLAAGAAGCGLKSEPIGACTAKASGTATCDGDEQHSQAEPAEAR